ncbi:MAG: heat-inducible transcriptional repressor HrcA [Myxococcota bacterium]|nr:heat-inducible transcriptional repressor HrcA [Myxococcota bacterium]
MSPRRSLAADPTGPISSVLLTDRQRLVLRALVAAYIAEAAPVGSATLSHLLSSPLSSASIRHTMGELRELGLVDQPHSSAGRVPTSQAIQIFVEQLMDEPELGAWDRRTLRDSFEGIDANAAVGMVGSVLSERARQLGFVVTPSLERIRLQHVSFVRLSSERLLVVLVACSGRVHRRVVEEPNAQDQAELDRIAALLNARIHNLTLDELRGRLNEELVGLRDRANDVVARALAMGLRAIDVDDEGPADLWLGTRLALLDQPEFQDPGRIRELYSAIETGESLLGIVERVVAAEGVSVAVGDQLDSPELSRCALVAAPYGRAGEAPQGVLGVIGACRMDYRRVIPLVDYCSLLVSRKLALVDEGGAASDGSSTAL